MISKLKNIVVALVAVAGFTMAQAATVHIQFDNPIFGGFATDTGATSDEIHITYAVSGGTKTEYVSAGRFSGKGSNVVGVDASIFVDSLDVLYMYCYDLYQDIAGGNSVVYEVDQSKAAVAARTLDFLGAVNSVLNAGQIKSDNYAWLHPKNGAMGAAIQLGIWESKYDTGWDLTSGNFTVTTADLMLETKSYWNSFIGELKSAPSLDSTDVMVLTSDTKQDMLVGDPQPVPEPGSLALIGLALAGVAAARRRSTAVAQS